MKKKKVLKMYIGNPRRISVDPKFHRNGPTKHLFHSGFRMSLVDTTQQKLSHLEGAPALHRATGLPVRGSGSRQGVRLVSERTLRRGAWVGVHCPPFPRNSYAGAYFM